MAQPTSSKDACPICLEDLESRGGLPIINPGCGHSLHLDCFRRAYTRVPNPTCSICRSELPFATALLGNANPSKRFSINSYGGSRPTPAEDIPLEEERIEPSPVPTAASSSAAVVGPPSLRIVPEYSILPVSAPAPLDLYAVATLRSPEHRSTASLDVVIVVDVSGSMEGEKMETVCRTVKYIFNTLRPQDRIALVKFNTQGQKVTSLIFCSPTNRLRFFRAVDSLQARGGTYLGSGLNAALDLLEQRQSRNPVSAIMLLSDGEDNRENLEAYTQLTARFQTNPAPVYSFGYGADHDVDKMTSLAVGGAYAFVQNVDTIQDAFAGCLGAMRSVALQDISVQFRSVDPRIKLKTLHSASKIEPIDPATGVVTFANLLDGESRDILVQLEYQSAPSSESSPASVPGEITVLSSSCSYTEVETQRAVQEAACAEGKVTIEPIVEFPPPHEHASVVVTKKRSEIMVTEALAQAVPLAATNQHQVARSLLSESRRVLIQMIIKAYVLPAELASLFPVPERTNVAEYHTIPCPDEFTNGDWLFWLGLLADIDSSIRKMDASRWSNAAISRIGNVVHQRRTQRSIFIDHFSHDVTPIQIMDNMSRQTPMSLTMQDLSARDREQTARSTVDPEPERPQPGHIRKLARRHTLQVDRRPPSDSHVAPETTSAQTTHLPDIEEPSSSMSAWLPAPEPFHVAAEPTALPSPAPGLPTMSEEPLSIVGTSGVTADPSQSAQAAPSEDEPTQTEVHQ
ncbi:uncharacterized protein BJ171DRAFT_157778 [Polychytrium aggregatum]|uniref:uncharacterized protein n=1 Tax=Polychytrium aggregatum TaxID=110093 RepID=UPI0022FE4089|nr:uncharacterized protein BJ171DRAFT_157778 [Polychytrium aggregatum]KAI9202993.1 hypothetical protein BJ171DRAFT_157778 [Polychytrium aggregatum]